MTLDDKFSKLKAIIGGLNGAVVAYSGGVDSSLLAFVVHQVLGDRALAVTAVSPTYPRQQLDEAVSLARHIGMRHQVIETDEFEDAQFVANSPDRCYYCKSALFRELLRLKDENGFEAVLDGANVDDLGDHRPGHRAACEMGVRSPLQEAGLTKAEIRALAKQLELPVWDKPAYACLASRIPYGQTITPEALERIDAAERFLRGLGFAEFRVRDHYPIARVEIGQSQLDKAWSERRLISEELHRLGFVYVALDLDGFRSGSMNAVLNK